MIKKALLETYFIDGTKRNYDQFSNLKRILNGKSESWYKMEIKKRIVLHKGKMNGISTLYYENSQIKRIENYKMMNLLTENVLMKTELKLLFSYYIKPEFPGGIKEFYKYVGENFKSLIALKDK
jgi:protein TonB